METVAISKHVVVAHFLARQGKLAIQVVDQRVRPVERSGQSLDQSDKEVATEHMGIRGPGPGAETRLKSPRPDPPAARLWA